MNQQHAAMDDAAEWAERNCRPTILSTWQQGASARRAGLSFEACPYRGTSAIAIRERSAWVNGWGWADLRMKEEAAPPAPAEPMQTLSLRNVRECMACGRAFTTDTVFATCPPCRAFPPQQI